MTVHFDAAAVLSASSPTRVLNAVRRGFEIEASGDVELPARIDTPTANGFFRCMPARLGSVMGVKTMTRTVGIGNRYLFLLSSSETGELLATFDAAPLTAQRTAGVTTLAGNVMAAAPPTSLAIIGTGMEADSHLRMMAATWPLESVIVWSRNAQRRQRFATVMSTELDVTVIAGETMETTLASSDTVVLATKSEAPVIDGSALRSGATVLSIGSTRPVLRELDAGSMARSRRLVVDSAPQVLAESGDIQTAITDGLLSEAHLVTLGDLLVGASDHPPDDGTGRDLDTFKSVGTALQDLALASDVLKHGTPSADLGELCQVKS